MILFDKQGNVVDIVLLENDGCLYPVYPDKEEGLTTGKDEGVKTGEWFLLLDIFSPKKRPFSIPLKLFEGEMEVGSISLKIVWAEPHRDTKFFMVKEKSDSGQKFTGIACKGRPGREVFQDFIDWLCSEEENELAERVQANSNLALV